MAEPRPRIFVKPEHDTLTPEQRAGFVLVGITSVLALIVGGFYIMRTLHKPFDISYEGPLFLSPAEKRALEVEKQKTKDTDGDGLTDYDELYVYRLSPYLKDTDGDGVGDAEEVKGDGTAAGPDVKVSATGGSQDVLNDITKMFGSGYYVPTPDVASINAATAGGSAEDLSNVTPELLRQSLRAQGATEEQLRYYTDQQLMDKYLEVLKQYQDEQAATDAGGTGQTGSTTPTTQTP